ncbi:MAG: hypothetical protein V2A54_10915 [Bacteroidota bacterium]
MKYLFLILFIVLSIDSYSQVKIKKRELKGEWFCSNKDSSFFKCDTLVFFKHCNRDHIDYLKKKDRPFVEPEYDLAKTSIMLHLTFLKNHIIRYVENNINGSSVCVVWEGPKWKLKKNSIEIYSDSTFSSFLIIKNEKVSFNAVINVATPVVLKTSKITVLRTKNSN